MVWLIIFFPLLNLPTNEGISVKIDGSIDLGPKWNFEYSFVPDGISRAHVPNSKTDSLHVSKHKQYDDSMKNLLEAEQLSVDNTIHHNNNIETPKYNKLKKSHHSKKHDDKKGIVDFASLVAMANNTMLVNKTHLLRIMPINDTQTLKIKKIHTITHKPNGEIYDKEHSVKEDPRIKEFTIHLFKQALRTFDRIKNKIDFDGNSNRDNIQSLAKNYKQKFTEFVNETQNQKIKTRLGTQKVILNTLDTSNRILKKLVDNLIAHTEDHTVLRQHHGIANVLTKEVDKEIQLEFDHVCHKYGLCRTGYGFTDFLAEVLNTVLQYDDVKLKKASDSFTEAARETDLGIWESHTQKKFIKGIERMEKWNDETLRHMLSTLKNVLLAKNQPLRINEGINMKDINRTVALLEILNTFHEKIPANKVNKIEWQGILTSLSDYSMGNRHDIQEIINAFITHVRDKGIKKFNSSANSNYIDQIRIVLKE